MAGLSLIGAGLALLEPETLGRPLPNTVEEINSWTLTLDSEGRERAKEVTKR